jgi:hypothetical protein
MTVLSVRERKRDLAPPDPTAVLCSRCLRSVSGEEAQATRWSFIVDGVVGLRALCPECVRAVVGDRPVSCLRAGFR